MDLTETLIIEKLTSTTLNETIEARKTETLRNWAQV